MGESVARLSRRNTNSRLELLYEEWEHVKILADQRMKPKHGHSFEVSLKTRCI